MATVDQKKELMRIQFFVSPGSDQSIGTCVR
jgi:hypothetical protein